MGAVLGGTGEEKSQGNLPQKSDDLPPTKSKKMPKKKSSLETADKLSVVSYPMPPPPRTPSSAAATGTQTAEEPVKDSKKAKFELFRQRIGLCVARQCFIPSNILINIVIEMIIVFLCWAIFFFLFGRDALPGSELFQLISLVMAAFFMGKFFTLALRMPSLLGQLIIGIVFRTAHYVPYNGKIYKFTVPAIRTAAMAIILLKAGLSLEKSTINKMKWVIFKLTILPCIGEAFGAALIAYFLIGCNWLWGLLLGFLLSSISPAVVIPPLIALKRRGYGEDKAIATLVIAAAGLDDILSISLFSVFHSMIFASGEIGGVIARAPLQLVLGICTGTLWGIFCGIFPHRHDEYVNVKRSVLLGIGCLATVFCCNHFEVESAGPLSCMVSAFVACLCWHIQREYETANQLESPNAPLHHLNTDGVALAYRVVWIVVEPFLFCMIGAEIDVMAFQAKKVSYAIIIILGALVFRSIVCTLALIKSGLNKKEVLFVNLAWLPKATVQAAIGTLPLEHVRALKKPETDPDYQLAMLLLTTAVLSILITAPIGSIAIQVTGPRLLKKVELPADINEAKGIANSDSEF